MEKLEARFETLEREMKSATLDYLDIYSKARKLFGRIAKQLDRQEEAEPAEVLPVNGGAGAATPLTGRAAQVQAQINRRRRFMGGGGA